MATLVDIKVKQKMGEELTEAEAAKIKKHFENKEGQRTRSKEKHTSFCLSINKNGKFGDKGVPTQFKNQPYTKFIGQWNNFQEEWSGQFQKQEIFLMAITQADNTNKEIKQAAQREIVQRLYKNLNDKGRSEWEAYKKKTGKQGVADLMFMLGSRTMGNLVKEVE